MRTGKIYYLISSCLLFLAAFIYLSPSFVTPDFIYPDRIDSLYVSFHSAQAQADPDSVDAENEKILFNPGSLNLPYDSFNVKTGDNLTLRGWFVAATDTPANTVLILHDLNKSKISYLYQIKQLRDRGLNVCVVDLRAHGNSDGLEFSPGTPAIKDVKNILDQLQLKNGVNHLILMGAGMGAAIAIQTAAFDARCEVLILQNPFQSLAIYLDRYAQDKWGFLKFLWYPVLLRKTEKLLQYPVRELNLNAFAEMVKIPTLFVTGPIDKFSSTTEVLSLYNASAADEKELILIDKKGDGVVEGVDADTYYNRIAEFINISLPKKAKTTRYKKLALNDQ